MLGDCITIGYGIIGEYEPWVNFTLDFIQGSTGLQLGNDIKELWKGTDNNATGYNEYLKQNPQKIMMGIIFCTQEIFIINQTYDCKNFKYKNNNTEVYMNNSMFYLIVQNNTGFIPSKYDTSSYPLAYDLNAMTLKFLVDNAIISFTTPSIPRNATPFMQLRQSFPIVTPRAHKNSDVINQLGSFYFFLMPMFIFIMLNSEIVREKQLKLRQGLNIFGLSHLSYWLSWTITGAIFSFYMSCATLFWGIEFRFLFYDQANFVVLILLFFMFTFSLVILAMFISTVAKTLRQANGISYGFVLLSIVLEILLAQEDILGYLYSNQTPAWVLIMKILLHLYPPYNYSLMFQNISNKAGYHYVFSSNLWVRGQGYGWKDMMDSTDGELSNNLQFSIPSGFFCLSMIIFDILFFALLTAYFDIVVEENRGIGKSWNFLCKRIKKNVNNSNNNYKNYKNYKNLSIDNDNKNDLNEILIEDNKNLPQTKKENQNLFKQSNRIQERSAINFGSSLLSDQIEFQSIQEEEEQQQNQFKNKQIINLKISNLSKVYDLSQNSILLCKKTKYIQALSNVYLDVNQGELVSILGHNGSGKTTLLNILIGILKFDSGNIQICGFDLVKDLSETRKLVGICPQFDILWEDLTAWEHLQLFSQIRGIKENQIKKLIKQKLIEMQLLELANCQVKTFSGGQKRRLSLALSSLGEPPILFLDEPTTGMDVSIRKEVWKLIQSIKKEKIILLTTHSMEEADVLSDRIAVLLQGKIECIGTSLFLKNKYGGGYKIVLVVRNFEEVEYCIEIMNKHFQEFNLERKHNLNIIYSIGFDFIEDFTKLIKVLEGTVTQNQQINDLYKIIADWGISHPTLEEVFMKVTGNHLKHLNSKFK